MAGKRRERLMLRVTKGALEPADNFTRQRMREKGYHVGDLVAAELFKIRNPGFHRLGHQIGTLCIRNIEDFSTYTSAHAVLKRLQLESGVACDETAIRAPGLGMVLHRTARSLSFIDMDEGEFHETVRGLCRHIAATYWPSLTPAQIEDMASAMVDEAP